MFQRYGKRGKSSQTKPLKDLIRIVPAAQLLAEEKRASLLEQMRNISALEEPRFDSLCLSLLHNFVNHCQSLPETSTSYYSQAGGVLDYALNRTEAALNLFKNYLSQDSQGTLSEEQSLWQYTLFSAAILQGIGKLQIDYSVDLYDNVGQHLKPWNPLIENFVVTGQYYSYEFQKESEDDFRRRLNIVLARFLMPASGFAWIASNSQVLAIWLALLNEDMDAAGTLGAILVRADAIAIQRYFNQFAAKGYGSGKAGRYGRVNTFTTKIPDSLADIEQQIGIEFLQWLSKSLNSGNIMINKAPLFMVPGGLLMTAEMFNLFMKDFPEYKNAQAIRNGFLSLGLHRLGVDGSVNSRFEQSSNQQMHSGIVFEKYAIALPENVHLNNLRSGKSSLVSATELIHQAKLNSSYFNSQQSVYSSSPLPQLNAAGQWVQEDSTSLELKKGSGVVTSV